MKNLTDKEIQVQKSAVSFAKKNKKRIAIDYADAIKYKPGKNPISVFMAGSPGAGKTEYSKNLIAILEKNKDRTVVRIDGDELRPEIPGYTGDNSSLFQGAISLIVEKIHDLALSNKQTFILDGTFAKYEKAINNIERSWNKNRHVFIFYIYQQPEVAWKFTQDRKIKDGRDIPKEVFIEQFLGAKNTVKRLYNNYLDKINIFLIIKNFEGDTEKFYIIDDKDFNIDYYIKDKYTKEVLEKLL